MDAAPVNLVLLRGLLPDLSLTPGTFVTARVLDGRTLSLAGVKLGAQLPDNVAAGQVLRLRVEEASTDRIHLRIVEMPGQQPQAEQAAAPQVPASAYQLALPGGAIARVHVEEREQGGGGRAGAGAARSVVVRYDSPTLGRLDIRLDAVSAAVHVSGGDPAARVRAAADQLRDALTRVGGAPVLVTVHPREQTLDDQAGAAAARRGAALRQGERRRAEGRRRGRRVDRRPDRRDRPRAGRAGPRGRRAGRGAGAAGARAGDPDRALRRGRRGPRLGLRARAEAEERAVDAIEGRLMGAQRT
jgi:hypothetical protein